MKYKPVLLFLLTAILVFVPLYIKFPLFRIPGTYVSIRMEDFIISLSVGAVVILYFRQMIGFFKTSVGKSVLLFWLIGLISLVSSYLVTQSANPILGLLHFLRRVEYMFLLVFGYVFVTGQKQNYNFFGYIMKLLLIVNLLIFTYGIGQRYLDFPVIVTQNEEYSKGIALRWIPGAHINSTFAGHYDLASYLILTIPVFINMYFLATNKFQKIILLISLAFSYWLLAGAASRISVVSLIVAITFSLLALKKYKELVLTLFISAIFFSFSPDLKARYIRIFDVVKEKLTLVSSVYAQDREILEDRSTSIRLNVEWPRALRAFAKNPLLGTGYSSISLATDNDYLRTLGEVGLLGFAAFCLIFVKAGKYIRKKWDTISRLSSFKKAFVIGFMGGIMGSFVTAVFIDIFEASKFATIFWLFMGLSLGLIKSDQKEHKLYT